MIIKITMPRIIAVITTTIKMVSVINDRFNETVIEIKILKIKT